MRIVNTILQSDIFQKQPPVLIDIGASGEINSKWKMIAPYSVCIAFDADNREFKISEQTNKGYKKLITFNRIVFAKSSDQQNFYLTSSPYCSSLLQPDEIKLNKWSFAGLFKVLEECKLPVITIKEALEQTGFEYVDWFKTDTQGTDLRLFTSLPESLSRKILALEFEPGIIDAYRGEDKLHAVMCEMDNDDFWLSSMIVKGTQRMSPYYLNGWSNRVVRNSPCWAEVSYLRQSFEAATERDLLLLYVFALIEKQPGFALEVADAGIKKFENPLFKKCIDAVFAKLRYEKLKTPLVIFKRRFNKLLSNIHD